MLFLAYFLYGYLSDERKESPPPCYTHHYPRLFLLWAFHELTMRTVSFYARVKKKKKKNVKSTYTTRTERKRKKKKHEQIYSSLSRPGTCYTWSFPHPIYEPLRLMLLRSLRLINI